MFNRLQSANPHNPTPDDLYSLHTSRPSLDISAFSKDFKYHNNPSRSLNAFSSFIKQRSMEFEVLSNRSTARSHGIGHEQMQNFFEKRSKEMDALEALVQDWKVEYMKGLISMTLANMMIRRSGRGSSCSRMCDDEGEIHRRYLGSDVCGETVKDRGIGSTV